MELLVHEQYRDGRRVLAVLVVLVVVIERVRVGAVVGGGGFW